MTRHNDLVDLLLYRLLIEQAKDYALFLLNREVASSRGTPARSA